MATCDSALPDQKLLDEVIDDIEDISKFDRIFSKDAKWMRTEIKSDCVNWLAELMPEADRKKLVPFAYELAKSPFDNIEDVNKTYTKLRKKYRFMAKKAQMNYVYRVLLNKGMVNKNVILEQYLVAKAVRSLSGVLVITVFTSPYPRYGNKVQRFSCKHNCYYCPNEPDLPRSYLSNEPGVRRGKRHSWEPVDQFYARAWTHYLNGHPIDKIEILVLGGTWSEYPQEYQEEFLRDIFWSANTFFDVPPKRKPLSLPEEQKINETTRARIIGLTLETRPDTIDEHEIRRFRYYGCTRVQVGIQHTDDGILKLINRGCYTKDAIKATKLLKDAGFKIDYHLMPDLPGTTIEKDIKMFDYVLYSEDLQADQWKIYPCQTVPWTVIEKWFKEGKYKPYSPQQLMHVLVTAMSKVHPWIRLNRVIRDIPNEYIMGGNPVTNLRQMVEIRMREKNLKCRCIRSRECKSAKSGIKDAILKQRRYKSSGGTEIFLSFESKDESVIYGFLRLRLCHPTKVVFPELKNAALVRELHTYGKMRPVGDSKASASASASKSGGGASSSSSFLMRMLDGSFLWSSSSSSSSSSGSSPAEKAQHMGFGKRLMRKAEEIAVQNKFPRVAVIAGIGTREYYARRGYHLEGTYMVKDLQATMLGFDMRMVRAILIVFIAIINAYILQTLATERGMH
mmetsp:Transcript_39758/g.64695  ORF Transcript_39758/g.64695 Transcript_39758/m.64695 type:complete len:678 (+) Transcript_39758:113-2146(+)